MPESDLPEHEKRAWDAIVADLSGQIDLGPQFPRDAAAPTPPPLAADGDFPDPLADHVDGDEEDERYVPPPPPPCPGPPTRSAGSPGRHWPPDHSW